MGASARTDHENDNGGILAVRARIPPFGVAVSASVARDREAAAARADRGEGLVAREDEGVRALGRVGEVGEHLAVTVERRVERTRARVPRERELPRFGRVHEEARVELFVAAGPARDE